MAQAMTPPPGWSWLEVPSVRPGELERALAELQDRVAGEEPIAPPCRTLAINLVVRAPASDEEGMREVVTRVLVRHPCRAFLLLGDDRARDPSVRLEAGLRRRDSTCQIVLELVTVRAPTEQLDRQAALVRPRIVADLPVVLFWHAPFAGHERDVALLARMADLVVFDSAELEDPRAGAERLERAARRPCRDLVEFRVRPWRRALAEAFEHFEWSSDVPTHVVVRHAPAKAALAAAVSLARWLERRLGAATRLAAEGDDAEARQPEALELDHGDRHVSVTRLGERLRVIVTLGDRCLLPFWLAASRAEAGDLLAAAVDEV